MHHDFTHDVPKGYFISVFQFKIYFLHLPGAMTPKMMHPAGC